MGDSVHVVSQFENNSPNNHCMTSLQVIRDTFNQQTEKFTKEFRSDAAVNASLSDVQCNVLSRLSSAMTDRILQRLVENTTDPQFQAAARDRRNAAQAAVDASAKCLQLGTKLKEKVAAEQKLQAEIGEKARKKYQDGWQRIQESVSNMHVDTKCEHDKNASMSHWCLEPAAADFASMDRTRKHIGLTKLAMERISDGHAMFMEREAKMKRASLEAPRARHPRKDSFLSWPEGLESDEDDLAALNALLQQQERANKRMKRHFENNVGSV